MTKSLNIKTRKLNKDGKKHAMAEYIGTFIKADGSQRTMHFCASENKIATYVQRGTMQTVFDCEKEQLRKFNFAKLVGQIMAVN